MDIREYERIVHKYQDLVLRVAMANINHLEDAKDITQDVFVKLFKQDAFIDDTHLKAWLIRVTVNQSHSLFRRHFRKNRMDVDFEYELASKEHITVKQELELLKPKERVYVYLHYIEGYTYKEIGQMLNKNEYTVASSIRRSLKKLKMVLSEETL